MDWILLGVAVRIAQAMGMHRDGTLFNLNPQEIQLRRRIWAKLRFLDVRAAEEIGCEPSIREASYDSLLPSNINDNDLTLNHGDATTNANISNRYLQQLDGNITDSGIGDLEFYTLVASSTHNSVRKDGTLYFTEMTFPLIRYELTGLLSEELGPKLNMPTSMILGNAELRSNEERRRRIDTIHEEITRKYNIGKWDMSDGMQRMALRLKNIQLSKARFLVDVKSYKDSVSTSQTGFTDGNQYVVFFSFYC